MLFVILSENLKFYNLRDVVWVKAITNQESGAWSQAFSSKTIGTLMDDRSF